MPAAQQQEWSKNSKPALTCATGGVDSTGRRERQRTLQVNFLASLLLDVSRMLPPDRSPCRMLMSCR